jgi:polar amino acid transport system substrate-binding protein
MTARIASRSGSRHRDPRPLFALCVLAGVAAIADAQTRAKCVTVEDVRRKGGWDIVTQVPTLEPYWFADENGDFQGMDYDLLVEVNRILDIPATRYTTVPWVGVLPALQAGKSDFVPEAVVASDARKKTFAFSYPEGTSPTVIMTRPDTGIQGPDDLAGKVVGVVTGSAAETTLLMVRESLKAKGKDFASLKQYQHGTDEMLDLGNRRIDALALNSAPVALYMKKHPGKFVNAGMIGDPRYLAWVFRKEDMGGPGCIGVEVNRALDALRSKGVLKAQQIKWFGFEMPLPDYSTWKTHE